MFNILIRTSNRPKSFQRCINSIKAQNYNNYRIIVATDKFGNNDYCKKYNPIICNYPENKQAINNINPFTANLYLNDLLADVKTGWILILDDDDLLSTPETLRTIKQKIKSVDNMILWKVKLTALNRIVPKFINVEPRIKDISMIGFCFHSKFIPLIHFAPYKQADFRLAQMLYSITKPIWINKILTQTQGEEGLGRRIDC